MKNIICKHCGGDIETGDLSCSHCGMPLPPNVGKNPQRKFIMFFIALIVFCVIMILWLPPDWIRFMKK